MCELMISQTEINFVFRIFTVNSFYDWLMSGCHSDSKI